MISQVLSLALLALLPLAAPAKMNVIFKWKEVDFAYPTPEERQAAVDSGAYNKDNVLPLGVEVYNSRVYVTLPRWKRGVPATLAYVQRPTNLDGPASSPVLNPYPNWEWNKENSGCDAFTSVFRVWADTCGRLWVIDAGKENVVVEPKQICPPQIFVFDLHNDTLLRRYQFPEADVKIHSFFTNIQVDVRNDANGGPKCEDVFAYVPDVLGYGVIVYSWRDNKSWRVDHEYFHPDPLFCKYTVGEHTFRWMDGIFSVALGPVDSSTNDRHLYFHPMSSSREFRVPASVMQNETASKEQPEKFEVFGSRGFNGHSSASAMDKNGILFYNLVTRDSVGCWNSKFPYRKPYFGEVDHDPETLQFPNDLKVDQFPDDLNAVQGGLDDWPVSREMLKTTFNQSVWVLSNRLQAFLYGELDKNDYNFRILAIPVEEAIQNNACHPDYTPEIDDLPSRISCEEDY